MTSSSVSGTTNNTNRILQKEQIPFSQKIQKIEGGNTASFPTSFQFVNQLDERKTDSTQGPGY
ncbi:MAG: hypothetical protein ACRDFB_05150, partial [Rhabdochlamydiaceae bacterium]